LHKSIGNEVFERTIFKCFHLSSKFKGLHCNIFIRTSLISHIAYIIVWSASTLKRLKMCSNKKVISRPRRLCDIRRLEYRVHCPRLYQLVERCDHSVQQLDGWTVWRNFTIEDNPREWVVPKKRKPKFSATPI